MNWIGTVFCGLAVACCGIAAAQVATNQVAPDADTFVRSAVPSGNYGGGGALSVSGPLAVNGVGETNGLFDTLMRFATSNTVDLLDATLGSQNWVITGVRLVLTEMSAPDNTIFNRGVGAFEIRWLAFDGWIEGTGKPKTPTDDGVAWQDLPGILNSNLDTPLGVFTNSGLDGPLSLTLALPDQLLQDIRLGNDVGFYLTAKSPDIGFTFNSREFGNTNGQPVLEITAAVNPRPRIDSITLEGGSVSITFGTLSNWTYHLQSTDGLPAASPLTWSNRLVIAARPTNGLVVYTENATNALRFYRLLVSP